MGFKQKVLKFWYFLRNKSYFEAVIRSNGNKVGEIIQIEPNNIKGGDFCLISTEFKKAWFKPFNFTTENLTDDEIKKLFGKTREEVETMQNNIQNSLLFIDGKKFVCVLDVEQAIPLYEDITSSSIEDGIFIKKTTVTKLKEDKIEQKKTTSKVKQKTGMPIKLKEIGIIPSMLFEMLQGNAVVQVNSKPPSKYEALAPVFIILVIVIGVVLWTLITSGSIKGL